MKLRTQFSLAFIPLLILSGVGLTQLARHSVHRIVLDDAADRGKERLEQLAVNGASALEKNSEQDLLPLLTNAMARLGAVYVLALDPDGKVVADTNVLEKDKRYSDAITQRALRSSESQIAETRLPSGPALDISWPVWQHAEAAGSSGEDFILSAGQQPSQRKRVGTLRIGLPLAHALEIEKKIVRNLAVLLAAVDALLLGLAVLLLLNVLRPVAKLVRVTEDVAQGRYAEKVPVPSAQELATLARSFNRMIEALAQTTVSKDFLDTILSNMLDPLVVLNADATIRMVNRAALEFLGYETNELAGQPASVLFGEADAILATVREKNRVADQEMEWKSKKGSTIPILFSGSVLTYQDGTLQGWVLVAKDMRERKKLEREMVQAEKLSAVGRLASGVAHEVNNPLGVILGYAQALLWDIKPGDPAEVALKAIERESMRCKHLVQELLNFARVSKTEREPMAINVAVESALSLVTAQARLSKSKVIKELAADLPHILGNPNQVQQVVINLANNALDAMKEIQGTLTIKTASVVDGTQAWVVLTVADTGPGIPADVLPRIFEPFFTTKPAGQGTGMGLGLVSEIIQKHSGTIDVRSQPGCTEFEIKFPASTRTAG
jgi:PAS domain S-box-containing protein